VCSEFDLSPDDWALGDASHETVRRHAFFKHLDAYGHERVVEAFIRERAALELGLEGHLDAELPPHAVLAHRQWPEVAALGDDAADVSGASALERIGCTGVISRGCVGDSLADGSARVESTPDVYSDHEELGVAC